MIKLVRLVSGEDVIAGVEKSGDKVVLNKPHRLIFSKEGLASMPLCPFSSDTTFTVSASNVLFEAEPEDEIKNSYASATGAIVVPSSGIVTP